MPKSYLQNSSNMYVQSDEIRQLGCFLIIIIMQTPTITEQCR